ncbi:hypothetical protein F5884DRAFT_779519 [Xylogone sp. PMI_703]|nr:hypothetical protein F5884DRAFT_779519 [Xylogone sp. PMI_703]
MDLSGYGPRFACMACRRLKKKCDRREPRCTHCLRNRRRCLYSDTSINEIPVLDAPSVGAKLPPSSSSNQPKEDPSSFPAVYFLDSGLFQRSFGQLPITQLAISSELQEFVGSKSSVRSHATSFFENIHPWIPFVSRRVFFERILSPLVPFQAEHILLLAAIKLVTTSPDSSDVRSAIYRHIKALFTEIEIAGQLTTRILQALILVALYELGHAIYPSAYLTIGQCARYGIALGLNHTIQLPAQHPWNMMDNEEDRRTWWTIVLLDRFVHLGCPHKVPVTEEPNGNSILPIDDELWEANRERLTIHTLSSPPTPAMGRFGLTIQMGILLGRALRNYRDTLLPAQDTSLDIQKDEAEILKGAISALANVTYDEAQIRGIGICGITKICHSALLILNTRYAEFKERQPSGQSEEEAQHINDENLYLAGRILEYSVLNDTLSYAGPREETSPFLLDAIYRSALIYMQEYLSSGDQDLLEGLSSLRSGFEKLNKRWKAAGAYLQLLEAHDTTGVLQ